MKIYDFFVGGSAGKGDTWSYEISVELTDEEAARLEASARKEPRWHLDEDPEISDIYDKVYAVGMDNELENYMETDLYEEDLQDYLDEAEWGEPEYSEEFGCWIKKLKAGTEKEIAEELFLDRYTFNVCYPSELQDLEVEEDQNNED